MAHEAGNTFRVSDQGEQAHATAAARAQRELEAQHSRNAVFAQLATQKLMRSVLLEVAEAIGFNQPFPFDAPARLGKLEVPYNDLAFARTAAGFQNSRLSVLGAAQIMYTITRGGQVLPLHLTHPPSPRRSPPVPCGRPSASAPRSSSRACSRSPCAAAPPPRRFRTSVGAATSAASRSLARRGP